MAGIDISKIQKNQNSSGKSQKQESGLFDFMNKDLSFGGNSLSDRSKEHFYADMGELLGSGIDIRSTIEMVLESTSKKKDAAIYRQIQELIIGGSSASEALKETGKFSDYEIFSVQIGEETGKLPQVLKQLGDYFNSRIKQKRQIVSALTYPILVLFVAFGAIGFMFYFIVPMFSDVFKRFDNDLPWITQKVIDLSTALEKNTYLIAGIILVLIVVPYVIREFSWYKKWSSWLLIRIPFFGELVRKSYLTRFSQSMQLMISSRIPLLRAVGLTKQMIAFYPLENALEVVEKDILQGHNLSQSLSKFKIFDKKMTALIKVGEEINKLDVFFQKLADQYSDEVEHKTSLLGSVVEPILIVFLGLIVCVILISMYLPLFQMSSNFG